MVAVGLRLGNGSCRVKAVAMQVVVGLRLLGHGRCTVKVGAMIGVGLRLYGPTVHHCVTYMRVHVHGLYCTSLCNMVFMFTWYYCTSSLCNMNACSGSQAPLYITTVHVTCNAMLVQVHRLYWPSLYDMHAC